MEMREETPQIRISAEIPPSAESWSEPSLPQLAARAEKASESTTPSQIRLSFVRKQIRTLHKVLLIGLGILLGNSLTRLQYEHSSASSNETAPDLDSFAEPAVAAQVLKKHSRALDEQCDAELASAISSPHRFQSRLNVWIERYEAELRQQRNILLESDVEHKLLILYKTSHRWEKFVDVYLHLARFDPEHPVVASWAHSALAHAGSKDRELEVTDTLQDIMRFHRDRVLAGRIEAAIGNARGKTDRAVEPKP